MSLKLYNSLTRTLEGFKPVEAGKARVYVCGPTVYGHSHLGHAKSYVSFDVLIRYLRYLGYDVTYVQNITDVGHLTDDADEGEDKLDVAARREKKHPLAIADFYTESYFQDMDRLNNLRPDICPRATGHIVEQIELVKTLIEKGFAYESGGSVYFDISKFAEYGKLSGRKVDEMMAGARVEVSQEKKNPADFAVWKKAEANHIMQWPSPWGMGYPGWHLECTVMSMKYLGDAVDIHGGGLENQFPHHECEIAQAEAATGRQFVRYWIHNNMVTVDGQKMGKSLGNFILLKEVFAGSHQKLSRAYDPLAVRQLVLNSHYRSPLDFSDASLHGAQSGYDRIKQAVTALRDKLKKAPSGEADKKVQERIEQFRGKFEEAMNDDLNTSVALSVIFDMVRYANDLLGRKDTSRQSLEKLNEIFTALGGDVLGIVQEEYAQVGGGGVDEQLLDGLVGILIDMRAKARADKDFATADAVRDKLGELGIVLEDSPEGTKWKKV